MTFRDEHRLSQKESRVCVAKLIEAVQNVGFHGDVILKFRRGELVHTDLLQSALPQDILSERFLCVLLKRGGQHAVQQKDVGIQNQSADTALDRS